MNGKLSVKRRSELKKQLQTWLDMSWPRWRINEACWDLFDANPETVDEVIAEIRHEQGCQMDINRREFMAQQMIRLEALAAKAQEEGNLAVALNAYRELHALAGLHGR
jgi:hypothetical protein